MLIPLLDNHSILHPLKMLTIKSVEVNIDISLLRTLLIRNMTGDVTYD